MAPGSTGALTVRFWCVPCVRPSVIIIDNHRLPANAGLLASVVIQFDLLYVTACMDEVWEPRFQHSCLLQTAACWAVIAYSHVVTHFVKHDNLSGTALSLRRKSVVDSKAKPCSADKKQLSLISPSLETTSGTLYLNPALLVLFCIHKNKNSTHLLRACKIRQALSAPQSTYLLDLLMNLFKLAHAFLMSLHCLVVFMHVVGFLFCFPGPVRTDSGKPYRDANPGLLCNTPCRLRCV